LGDRIERIKKVQDCTLSVSAIKNITHLNHDRVSARPLVPFVDHFSETKALFQSQQVAVHVTKRDHSPYSRSSHPR
jgi:hypothetical protein